MIRLRQTGRKNDRHRYGRSSVTSQRRHRHLLLIHFRYRKIMVEDTARRTPDLANVRLFAEVYMKMDDTELGIRWWGQSLNNTIGPRD